MIVHGHTPSSVWAIFIKSTHTSLWKALTIECLACANDPTCMIGSTHLIYSLKGLPVFSIFQDQYHKSSNWPPGACLFLVLFDGDLFTGSFSLEGLIAVSSTCYKVLASKALFLNYIERLY